MTAGDIRTVFEDFKNEKIDDNKFYKWLNYVDQWLYQKLTTIDPERFILEASYSVNGGVSAYDLPLDFWHINGKDCGFFSVAGTEPVAKFAPTAYGSRRVGYFLRGEQVCFTGNLNGAVLLRYLPRRPVITAEDSALIGGADFQEFYEQALTVQLAIDDEELNDEALARERLRSLLQDLFALFNRDQAALDLGVGDFY